MKRPQLVAGSVEQGFGVGPDLGNGPGGSATSLPGGGCLDAQVRGGGFQLADQPVDAGGGSAFARRGYGDRAVDQPGPQVRGDLDRGDGGRDAQGALEPPCLGERADCFVQEPGGIAELRLGHHGPDAGAEFPR